MNIYFILPEGEWPIFLKMHSKLISLPMSITLRKVRFSQEIFFSLSRTVIQVEIKSLILMVTNEQMGQSMYLSEQRTLFNIKSALAFLQETYDSHLTNDEKVMYKFLLTLFQKQGAEITNYSYAMSMLRNLVQRTNRRLENKATMK